jgi:2-phospho-L-lactate guanylyltransferase
MAMSNSKIFAIVPVKQFENAKTRLSEILSLDERISLSSIMLEETLQVLAATPGLQEVVVVSSDRRAGELASRTGAAFLHEEKDSGVNAAVEIGNAYSIGKSADATLVIPQDIPLMGSNEIVMACSLAERETRCVVISPSLRYDGTNLLLRKPPDAIPTSFDRNSYENHIASANKRGIPAKLFLSKNVMIDIDTPDDVKMLSNDNHSGKVLEFLNRVGSSRAA